MNANNRRQFLWQAAGGTAGLLVLNDARSAFGYQANESIGVALIGCGGRGSWFVETIPKLERLVALCDVNDRRAAKAFEAFPDLPRYRDFRAMLDERAREIDAVVIAAPDHIHAPASLAALRAGKPVFCEKPLTHDIHEARVLRREAAGSPLATQMGNQGTASEAFRRAVELVQAGTIGEVRAVHAWNEGGGAGRAQLPEGDAQPIPDTLSWDLWLGPAPPRPFLPEWLQWHAWREFGTGQLGNWALHTMNLPFKALKLDTLWDDSPAPSSTPPRVRVRAEVEEIRRASFPRWEIVTYEFPARGNLPPVSVRWYNGHNIPPGERRKIEELLGHRLDWGDAGEKKWADYAGCLLIGSKGLIHSTGHNMSFSLLPEGQFDDIERVPRTLPRTLGHEIEWFRAIRGEATTMSSFDYAGRLAEFCLLGNIATQFPEPLEFDPVACSVVGHPEADRALRRESYRPGWAI